MNKDFQNWHRIKKELHETDKSKLFFNEREVWWCHLGVNIGYEQDGRGNDYQRPVVILKQFNLDVCVVVPLTTTDKTGKFYFPIGLIDGREAKAVLSQIRLIDRKRLTNKIDVIDEVLFKKLVQETARVSLGLNVGKG